METEFTICGRRVEILAAGTGSWLIWVDGRSIGRRSGEYNTVYFAVRKDIVMGRVA